VGKGGCSQENDPPTPPGLTEALSIADISEGSVNATERIFAASLIPRSSTRAEMTMSSPSALECWKFVCLEDRSLIMSKHPHQLLLRRGTQSAGSGSPTEVQRLCISGSSSAHILGRLSLISSHGNWLSTPKCDVGGKSAGLSIVASLNETYSDSLGA
jgi:hypothetical protein